MANAFQPRIDDQEAPLRGIRVVEFGQYIAAPAAGQALADLGADVIKIEPDGGDAARQIGWVQDDCGPMFSAYNRGKRSVVLNLRSAEGQQHAHRLVDRADIVLQNARPGSLERIGLGAKKLTERLPRLIYGQVSGFGQTGPASVRAGLDIAAQAESGMMSLNGEAGRAPVRIGFTVVDVLTAQTLVSGVLAALYRRTVTGRGSLIDLSLIDVAVTSLANAWAEYRLQNEVPMRRGNGQPMAAPAAEVVATRDGLVVVSAYTQQHFPRLCAAIGQASLASDPRFADNHSRVQNRTELLTILDAAFGRFSTGQVCDLLTDAGVVVGAIRTMDQIHPGQNGVSEDLFVPTHTAKRTAMNIPGLSLLSDYRRRSGKLPHLGEHTAEVLAELQ